MSKKDNHCGGGHRLGITCREISDFLLAYVERELAGEVREEFERHMKLCPPCGHYIEGYSETIKLVRECGRQEAETHEKPKPPPEALIQAILAAKQQIPEDQIPEDP